MDGVLPDGTKLDVGARSRAAGLQLRADDDAPPELPRAAAAAPVVPARGAVTGGGSSIPAVQALLRVLASGRDVAELGTAFGEGAAAIAETARSLVTVECDPERAAVARERLAAFANVEALEGDAYELLRGRGPFGLVFADGGVYDWEQLLDAARARRLAREGRSDAGPRDRRRSRAGVPAPRSAARRGRDPHDAGARGDRRGQTALTSSAARASAARARARAACSARIDGRAPFARATCSQSTAESEPVTARFGPEVEPEQERARMRRRMRREHDRRRQVVHEHRRAGREPRRLPAAACSRRWTFAPRAIAPSSTATPSTPSSSSGFAARSERAHAESRRRPRRARRARAPAAPAATARARAPPRRRRRACRHRRGSRARRRAAATAAASSRRNTSATNTIVSATDTAHAAARRCANVDAAHVLVARARSGSSGSSRGGAATPRSP